MDKRLHIFDIVLIAKATVESKDDIVKFTKAIVSGLEKQEKEKVEFRAAQLRRELLNMIEGKSPDEGREEEYQKQLDLVQAATGMTSHDVASAPPLSPARKASPTFKPRD